MIGTRKRGWQMGSLVISLNGGYAGDSTGGAIMGMPNRDKHDPMESVKSLFFDWTSSKSDDRGRAGVTQTYQARERLQPNSERSLRTSKIIIPIRCI